MIRAALLLSILTSLGWWLHREQHAGHLQKLDERFLDFLVANTRERFEEAAKPGTESPVVLVKMRAVDKADYAGWPPRPLDWQMIFKTLRSFEPSVLVIPETIFWGRPPPEFTREAAEALLPFPSVVLGIEAQMTTDTDRPAFLGGLDDALPCFLKVAGDTHAVPRLGALVIAPEEMLRRQAEIGIAIAREENGRTLLPYAVQEGGRLRPTVLAQALARATHTPYAMHRLHLGPGAGAYLAGGVFLPLTHQGDFTWKSAQTLPEIDALSLMTSELAGTLTAAEKQILSLGKIIVIGTEDTAGNGLARQYAQALSHALTLPRLRVLPAYGQWIVWAMAGLAGFWLVFRVPRKKALLRGTALIFAGGVICFLAFQSALIWCPPALPAALLAASALFARVAGAVKG